ncbi:hypothetical protein CDD82_5269 [Ophiocordyceps australis]|uniref:Uncharacterized protein n=1 Tax=Ophiocordyceps australis TaxID=1399860 RepID=A0A2C5Z299_9HYPO|nr:hypothetical protein CDD82_5269 [Ophiocordyceps australis]
MPINHVVLASGAVAAVSVALATALVVYESPEVQRYAEHVRRRIAMALHSIGSNIDPSFSPHPRFNRPEDADGFLRSRAEAGVDADDESRRRQREELMYWNNLRLEKQQAKARREAQQEATSSTVQTGPHVRALGPSFDDFLHRDGHLDSQQNAFIFNSGPETHDASAAGLRYRGQPSRGYETASYYMNPFADEHHVDNSEVADMMAPSPPEGFSDIYSATTLEDMSSATADVSPVAESEFMARNQVSQDALELLHPAHVPDDGIHDDSSGVYSSIQAWATNSSQDFYSPLPTTPTAPMSEGEMISDGQLTPIDSVSLVGSGEEIAMGAQSSHGGDVMSMSEGMLTPASWSEVGSVVSENDGQEHA